MSTPFEIESFDEYLNTIHSELRQNGEGKRLFIFAGKASALRKAIR